MKRTNSRATVIFLGVFLTNCADGRCGPLIQNLTPIGGLNGGPTTVGFTFRLTSFEKTVSHLGVFDYQQDGLEVAVDVGLWEVQPHPTGPPGFDLPLSVSTGDGLVDNPGDYVRGKLLREVTIPGGQLAELLGHFRYAALEEPITIRPDVNYVIGAFHKGVAYTSGTENVDFSVRYGVEVVDARSSELNVDNSSMQFPQREWNPNGALLGPNLIFAPEPRSIVLIALAGVAVLAWRFTRPSPSPAKSALDSTLRRRNRSGPQFDRVFRS